STAVSPLRMTSTDSQSVDSLDIAYDAESVINAKTKRSGKSVHGIQPQSTIPSNPYENLTDDLQLLDRSVDQRILPTLSVNRTSQSRIFQNERHRHLVHLLEKIIRKNQLRAPHSATAMHITTRAVYL
ncbi:unnamed protein product, partial [Didymodactylos carnosus]